MAPVRENRLLQALPHPYKEALLARLEFVALPISTVLYYPDKTPKYAHFVTSGMTSIVTYMEDGSGVEVGLVSNEGMVESLHMLGASAVPTTGFMQIAGSALRMPYEVLHTEFLSNAIVRSLILQAVQRQTLIVSQVAACNRLHEVEERMARWLLMVRDRIGADEFYLTQEFLAQMIGARRTTVTMVAGALQRSGLIQYSRGNLQILDAARLEEAACECYPIIRTTTANAYLSE
jgi:CRP-like cAMP-binding protein